mmetsp:Transcript_32085/g.102087  ORF Transcript_32085/g.102087 Transcript_32085/m.102087 type:complete len:194 (-) Transcript_32085:84-665(-)|eukprot:CAMPEP_0118887296 /NCGR_PEP_ID=MMETSP1163-20130328/25055_1 /TAXON_ID=124430 /ORGANISM="Phaeomonas parva, Strain CCMP2877" /LENGTH=193 /DNA_ID=CAMNT_0006825701 /DNA_START=14 /DNA_END=595 /DNA_ORIENTATION=+
MADSAAAETTPAVRFRAFVSGLQAVLQSWTALNLAIEQNWGGGNSNAKAQALFETLLATFQKGKDIYPDVIEDILLVRMDEDFQTRCDDGSIEEVARCLVQMYNECGAGNFTLVQTTMSRLQERQQRGQSAAASSANGGEAPEEDGDDADSAGDEDAGMDEDGDAMDEDGGAAAAEEDDGWNTVPVKGRKGRR